MAIGRNKSGGKAGMFQRNGLSQDRFKIRE